MKKWWRHADIFPKVYIRRCVRESCMTYPSTPWPHLPTHNTSSFLRVESVLVCTCASNDQASKVSHALAALTRPLCRGSLGLIFYWNRVFWNQNPQKQVLGTHRTWVDPQVRFSIGNQIEPGNLEKVRWFSNRNLMGFLLTIFPLVVINYNCLYCGEILLQSRQI